MYQYENLVSYLPLSQVMTLDHAFVKMMLPPYLISDFEGFVRSNYTAESVYEVVPGDFAQKLATKRNQHKYGGIFNGDEAAVKMIL